MYTIAAVEPLARNADAARSICSATPSSTATATGTAVLTGPIGQRGRPASAATAAAECHNSENRRIFAVVALELGVRAKPTCPNNDRIATGGPPEGASNHSAASTTAADVVSTSCTATTDNQVVYVTGSS